MVYYIEKIYAKICKKEIEKAIREGSKYELFIILKMCYFPDIDV
jgi:hypothetical protein